MPDAIPIFSYYKCSHSLPTSASLPSTRDDDWLLWHSKLWINTLCSYMGDPHVFPHQKIKWSMGSWTKVVMVDYNKHHAEQRASLDNGGSYFISVALYISVELVSEEFWCINLNSSVTVPNHVSKINKWRHSCINCYPMFRPLEVLPFGWCFLLICQLIYL